MAEQRYLLSVIVPFHNDEAFITACLTSLLTQADDDMQIVIIDDGSTDGSTQQVTALVRATLTATSLLSASKIRALRQRAMWDYGMRTASL